MSGFADVQQVTNASALLKLCSDRLEQLNQAVTRQQWQQAATLASEYSGMLARLSDLDQSGTVLDEMVQLDIRHRRCMRKLSQKMTDMGEQINRLEAGQKSVRQARNLIDPAGQSH